MQNAQVFQKGKNLNPVEKMQFGPLEHGDISLGCKFGHKFKKICDNFYDDNISFDFYENLRYQCACTINKKKDGHADSLVKTNTNLELIN